MVWHGKLPVYKALAIAIGVPVAIFVVFEVWFLVPLPKGPLESCWLLAPVDRNGQARADL